MLTSSVPLGPTTSDEVRYETNLQSHRRLHPELLRVDVRLQIWGGWAKPQYGNLGYPTRSTSELLNEGGLLARDANPVHPPDWPEEIVQADRQVAALPTRHMAAIMATYFHLALHAEQRALIYARYAPFLAKTRGREAVMRDRQAEGYGLETFRRDLDRARWTLKHALAL